MTSYLLVFHEGRKPRNLTELMHNIRAWKSWFEGMGDRLLDGGNGTVTNHHGDHSFGGFCVLEVADRNEAIATAKDCPILASGGRVELMELGEQTRQIGP